MLEPVPLEGGGDEGVAALVELGLDAGVEDALLRISEYLTATAGASLTVRIVSRDPWSLTM